MTSATIPVTAVTPTTQVRVMTPLPAATTTVPRPAQPVQQRLVRYKKRFNFVTLEYII